MKTNRQLEILECFYGDGMVQRKKSCPKIEECAMQTGLRVPEVEVCTCKVFLIYLNNLMLFIL